MVTLILCPAYHIGIVIVNSNGSRSMIHAGGGDSSTHGDDPNACVKISSLEIFSPF